MKVVVYAISKNEEQFVDRWVDSVQEADMIIVADTGSTDRTIERLRARGVQVHSIAVDPWRFDVARNRSLNLVPVDADVCVCIDLDEVLNTGWRNRLEEIWKPGTTRLNYMYTWSFNEDGSRGVTFWKEKIHARHHYVWTYPVHEVLKYIGQKEVQIWDDKIQLDHYPDLHKSRSNYLPLLEMSVLEVPDDDRNMHYLGREYMYHHKWDECIEVLKKHLSMPSSIWDAERSASMRFIARAYQQKGNKKESRRWLYRAIAEAPHLREPYVELAKLAHSEGDWLTGYHMVEEALKIKERPISYINEAFAWDATVYDIGALCCYELGLSVRAVEFAQMATIAAPHDLRIVNNFTIIRDWANNLSKKG